MAEELPSFRPKDNVCEAVCTLASHLDFRAAEFLYRNLHIKLFNANSVCVQIGVGLVFGPGGSRLRSARFHSHPVI